MKCKHFLIALLIGFIYLMYQAEEHFEHLV